MPTETVPAHNAPSVPLLDEPPVRCSPTKAIKLPATNPEGEEISTVHDVLKYASSTFGKKAVVRYAYDEAAAQKRPTFADMHSRVQALALGLGALGVRSGNVVDMFHPTSYEWQLVHHACMAIGATVANGRRKKNEFTTPFNKALVLFTTSDRLGRLPNTLDTIQIIIYTGKAKASIVESFASTHPNVKLLTLDDLPKETTAAAPDQDAPAPNQNEPKAEDIAIIMHTATTNKDVYITHANLIASLAGMSPLLSRYIREDDTVLHYLPLEHMFEYMFELAFLFFGISAGYGSVETLKDDLAAFRPSLMIGVPALWDTVHQTMSAQFESADEAEKVAFNAALAVEKAGVPGVRNAILKGIKAVTGGRLRLAVSVGSALRHGTQSFPLTAVLKILPCYGLTETCGICTILRPDDSNLDSVGAIVPGLQIKLVDVQGTDAQEILVRGSSVAQRYSMDQPTMVEGWLRTGDVGRWNEDNTLSIVGRVVERERRHLESAYKDSGDFKNVAIVVTLYDNRELLVAVVHPRKDSEKLRQGTNNDSTNLRDWCELPEVKERVDQECRAVATRAGFETKKLAAVVLTDVELTMTNKAERRRVEDQVKDLVKAALEAKSPAPIRGAQE